MLMSSYVTPIIELLLYSETGSMFNEPSSQARQVSKAVL